jgi:PAS domain S-box-containing protein
MTQAAKNTPLRQRRVDWMLGTAVLVILACLWGALLGFLGYERRQTLRQTENDALTLSLAFEEQTFWLLATVEQLLNSLKDGVERNPEGFDLATTVRRFAIPLDVALQAALIGADGRLLASNLGPVTERIDLSDREHFRVHRERADIGLFVSKPVLGRISNRWSIQLTRRVDRPDGSFGGVLVISIDPLYFARFYQTVPLGREGAVKLVGTDGVVRAFSGGLPMAQGGLSLSDSPLMELWRESPTGVYVADGSLDEVRRIYGYRQVRRHPLIVMVGLGETAALAPWRAFAARVAVAGAGVTAAILVMAAFLLAAVRRRQRQELALASKQVELIRLNHELEATQRLADLGSWELDVRTRRVEWSEETFRIAGLEPGGAPPSFDAYLATVHPDDRALLTASLQALLEDGTPYDLELRHVRPDGTWNHVLTRAEPVVEDGAVVRVRGSMLDITQRKAQEAELRESRNLARQIADLSPNVIYILDLETRAFLYGNRDAWAFFGYSEEQARDLGPNLLRSIVHPDDLPSAEGRLVRFAAMGDDEVLEFEQRVRHASGEWRWLWYREKVFRRGPDGRPTQVLGTGQDVTERKRNELNLDEARRAAEAAARSREQFLAMMSHEIRTPMTGVLGLADLLMGTELTPEQRRILGTLRGSACDLLTVLNDVLDFSKIQAGQLTIEEVDVDLHRTLRDVRELYASQASKKGLRIELEIDEAATPRWVRTDPTRLRQILFNLVGNAIKFTPRGRVTLSVAAHRFGRGGPRDALRLDFAVSDTGIGMTRDQIGRLFQPFVQGDSSTTRRFGGTGLGLSISRSLVEALGGAITAESRPGEGSTFRFSVRAGLGSPVASEPGAAEVERTARSGRILLAEDNPVNRMLIATMLERAGHAVEGVENGRQAVDAAAAKPFDLILLDMQMPVMDGIEAAREIRALPSASSRAAIVGLSADAMAETIRRAREAGFDDYVTKPIDWARLHSVIATVLGATVLGSAVPGSAAPGAGAPAEGPAEAPVEAEPARAYAPHAVLAEETARELETFFGRDGAAGFYQSLIERMEESAARMREAAAAGDAHALRAEAHALRGAAGNMGADRLGAILADVERRAREGVVPAELMPPLEAAAAVTRAAIARRMGIQEAGAGAAAV